MAGAVRVEWDQEGAGHACVARGLIALPGRQQKGLTGERGQGDRLLPGWMTGEGRCTATAQAAHILADGCIVRGLDLVVATHVLRFGEPASKKKTRSARGDDMLEART